MTTAQIVLPELHPAQETIYQAKRRFNVVDCGRRWGKDILGMNVLIQDGILRGLPTAWFSPTYKNLAEDWRMLEEYLDPIKKHKDRSEHRIETLIPGGTLEMWSLDQPDAARGRKYGLIVINEAAMIRYLRDSWWKVIRPTLADLIGSAWFLSTPRGYNFFKTAFDWGQDALMPDWISWKRPTSTNPYIRPEEIEAARQEMPERMFAQEFLAEFIEEGSGVFRNIEEAARATPQVSRIPGHDYVIGADWGREYDFTVYTVLDLTLREQCRLDRSNKVEYQLQQGRLAALNDAFKPLLIVPELNSMGVPICEALQRMGLPIRPFNTTHASKMKAIDDLALAFEKRELAILDDPVLKSELLAFEMEKLPSGTIRYSAPEGYHDDCVMSLALAYSGLGRKLQVW